MSLKKARGRLYRSDVHGPLFTVAMLIVGIGGGISAIFSSAHRADDLKAAAVGLALGGVSLAMWLSDMRWFDRKRSRDEGDKG